jgi:hypothetical protein
MLMSRWRCRWKQILKEWLVLWQVEQTDSG